VRIPAVPMPAESSVADRPNLLVSV
jgi:hypothetical protein